MNSFRFPVAFSIRTLLLASGFAALLISCEEEGPIINMNPPNTSLVDTTYTDNTVVPVQTRGVLVKDFTGVKCPNCPQAHNTAAAIEAGSANVVVVAIHPGLSNLNALVAPRSGFKRDLRNYSGGQILQNLVGIPPSLPYGDVNRKKFPSEQYLYVPYSSWQSHVNSELLLSTPVNIELSSFYEPSTRELLIQAEVRYTSTATDSGAHFLSLFLTESNIVTMQDNGSNFDTFYVHNHVLDTVITPYGGIQLTSGKLQGRVYIKQYKITLPANYVVADCEIVGFVHLVGTKMDVVHAVSKPVL